MPICRRNRNAFRFYPPPCRFRHGWTGTLQNWGAGGARSPCKGTRSTMKPVWGFQTRFPMQCLPCSTGNPGLKFLVAGFRYLFLLCLGWSGDAQSIFVETNRTNQTKIDYFQQCVAWPSLQAALGHGQVAPAAKPTARVQET